MLVIRDRFGKHRIIAQMGEDVIPFLHLVQQKLDGQASLWDSNRREYVSMSDLLLETARPFEGSVLPSVERAAG